MSVIASTNPAVIKEVFHPKCHEVTRNGLYVLKFYRNRRPKYVEIDDRLPAKSNNVHAFAEILKDEK